MAGKIPWYLKDGGRDPDAGARRTLAGIIAKMSPTTRAAWAQVREANEYFDGETAIELSTLRRWLGGRVTR